MLIDANSRAFSTDRTVNGYHLIVRRKWMPGKRIRHVTLNTRAREGLEGQKMLNRLLRNIRDPET